MFIHQELSRDLASKTALLPAVLQRGTKRFPDSISLRRELENLYGADLATDVGKKGERHIIELGIDMVRPDLLADKTLLPKSLQMMTDLIKDPLIENEGFPRSKDPLIENEGFPRSKDSLIENEGIRSSKDPLIEGEGFRRSYVDQEKDQLAQEIKSLINDKTSYAMEQCIRQMCANERYAVYKLGELDTLETVNAKELYGYSQKIIRENPIDIYLVGLSDEKEVEALFEEAFTFPRAEKTRDIAETEVYREPKKEILTIDEVMSVSQGKLIMGYRTNIPYNHDLYYALAFYNGILGTFPHSKLFQNVREKASLAYFVFSRLERHKGLMMVAAGIDAKDYGKAVEIIMEQTAAIARGDISAEEMENTRIGFMNQLRAQEDSAGGLISFFFEGRVGGRANDLAAMMEELKKVKIEDVVAVAQKVSLDTIYFLHGEERGITI